MSVKKKRKKKKSLAVVRFFLLLIVAAVIGIVVWQVQGYMASNATTAIAKSDTLGNSYSGTLVIA